MTSYETVKIAQYELSGVFSLDELKELVQQIEEHEAKMREHLAKAMKPTKIICRGEDYERAMKLWKSQEAEDE